MTVKEAYRMKPFEQALLIDCATKCAFEIYKTLRLFKDITPTERLTIKTGLEQTISEYLVELENANRN